MLNVIDAKVESGAKNILQFIMSDLKGLYQNNIILNQLILRQKALLIEIDKYVIPRTGYWEE